MNAFTFVAGERGLLTLEQLGEMAARRGELDHHAAFPQQDIDLLAQSGLLAAPLPKQYGGIGLGTSAAGALPAMKILGQLGGVNLSLARLFEGHINALKLVVRYATPQQIEHVASDLDAGQMFGIWNTEGRDGVRLKPASAGFLLQGKKQFASGAGFLRRAIVTARRPDGALVLVHAKIDPEAQSFSHAAWRLQGMQATATGEINLSGIEISGGDIIGLDGDYLREPDFSAGAWRTLAAQLGAMESLFALFLADLRETGRGSHSVQRVRLAEVAIACETARLWVKGCAHRAESGAESAVDAITYVNLARAAVSRAAEETISRVQRGIGARAFLISNPAEQTARDLSFYLRQPAPDQTLDEAAEALLKNGT